MKENILGAKKKSQLQTLAKIQIAKQVQTNRPEQYKCILVQEVLCKCKGGGGIY